MWNIFVAIMEVTFGSSQETSLSLSSLWIVTFVSKPDKCLFIGCIIIFEYNPLTHSQWHTPVLSMNFSVRLCFNSVKVMNQLLYCKNTQKCWVSYKKLSIATPSWALWVAYECLNAQRGFSLIESTCLHSFPSSMMGNLAPVQAHC